MPAPIEEPQHEEESTAVPPSPPVPSLALSHEVQRVNNLVQSMKDRLIQMNTNNPDSDLSEATRAKPFFVANKDKYVALLPLQSQGTGSEIFQALNQYGRVIYNNKGLFDSLNRLATSFVTDASPNENKKAKTGQLWLWRNSSISFYCHEQLLKNMLDTLRSQVVIFFPHTSAGYQGDITALRQLILKEKVIPISMFYLLLQLYLKTNSAITENIPHVPSTHIEKQFGDKTYSVFSVYHNEDFRISKEVVKEILDVLFTGGMGETNNPAAPDLSWDANKWFEEQTMGLSPAADGPAPSLADSWFASIASSLAPAPPS
jgi:hypothetical protein